MSLRNHIEMQSGGGDYKPPLLRLITLLLVVYLYDVDQDTFRQLPDMPESLPVQLWNAKKALQSIDEGAVNMMTIDMHAAKVPGPGGCIPSSGSLQTVLCFVPS